MSDIFGRRYELTIGNDQEQRIFSMGLNSAGRAIRISFLVQHEIGGFYSFAEITIYNLSRETEQSIFDQYKYIRLQAGTGDQFGLIFQGQMINHQRVGGGASGTNGIKLFCQSNGEDQARKRINLTFSPETEMIEVISACAQEISDNVQFYGYFLDLKKRSGGTTLQGNPRTVMADLSKSLDFTWTVENGLLKVIRNGFVLENNTYVFNSQTGMIGAPTVSDSEISVRTALNPLVSIGNKIKIESEFPEFTFSGVYFRTVPRSIGEGIYQVSRIVYTGDTHQGGWESQFSALRLDATGQANLSERFSR